MRIGNPGNRKFWPYKEGDQVWIEGTNIKTIYPTTKLAPKRYGPFKVLKHLSDAIYQVEIPWQWKIHNVFHANLLTPYKEMELHGPNFTQPPPDLIDGEPEYEVEKILDKKPRGRGCKIHYLIKWKGYPVSDNSWEPAASVHTPQLIAEFEERNKSKQKKRIKGGRVKSKETHPPSHQIHLRTTFTKEMSTTSAPAAISTAASPTPTDLSISQILQPEAWRSPTPTSVPDNTPEEPPTLQLACRTNPMIEEESESVSAIDYSTRVKEAKEDVVPVGYVFNDPQSGHFYPVYIENPKFGETRMEPRITMTKYVKYAVNYTYVKGTMRIGHEVRTVPVTVGRRAHFYARMTEEN